MTEIKDFSRERKAIQFRVDTDVFHAAPAIPAEIMLEFATRYEDASSIKGVDKQYDALSGVLELVLLEDSYQLIRRRMRDRSRPIDLAQLNDIVVWLMEQYGMRPTRAPRESSPGRRNRASGMNSKATAPDEESTSELSPQTVS